MTERSADERRGARVVIGYVRVSTDRQGREGGSLKNQEEAIRQFAARLQLPVAEIFQDVRSASGERSVDDRKGLQDALKACRDCDGLLVVWDWSRLSRHAEAVEVIRRQLPDSDRLLSIHEGETFEQAARHARLAKAQQDRELISLQTKTAMDLKKSQGATFGNPKIKEVQASGAESMSRQADALVMKIVEILRDEADWAKLTYREVVDLLNARGLRTGHDQPWTTSRVRIPLQKARAVLNDEEQADRQRMETDPDFGRF